MTKQYLELLARILDEGTLVKNRTGVDTIKLFGHTSTYDLSEGFPLLTTKEMFTKGVFVELLWFLRGETNIKSLVEQEVKIWNDDAYRSHLKNSDVEKLTLKEFGAKIRENPEFAAKYGELGPVYGKQWRDFGGVDQITQLEQRLRANPESRRHIVTAWNPPDVEKVALPPCHVLYQCDVTNGKLSMNMYQRSADTILGVPFNVASYATLLMMLAQTTGLKPGTFKHMFGDVHIYANHLEQAKEQLRREPRPLPHLHLNPERESVLDFQLEDFKIEGYHPHPPIKAPLNVGLPPGKTQ